MLGLPIHSNLNYFRKLRPVRLLNDQLEGFDRDGGIHRRCTRLRRRFVNPAMRHASCEIAGDLFPKLLHRKKIHRGVAPNCVDLLQKGGVGEGA